MDPKAMERLEQLAKLLNDGLTKEEFVSSFQNVVDIILKLGERLNGDYDSMRTDLGAFKKAVQEDTSSDIEEIKTASRVAIGSAISSLIADTKARLGKMEDTVSQLRNGKDADEEVMLARLQALLPSLDDLKNDLPRMGEQIRDSLELLQGDERLDISAIKGWEKLRDDIAAAQKSGKPISFVGGARGVFVYIGGAKKGIVNSLNFAPGTNMSIAYSFVNGLPTITFNSSGGGGSGVTVETPPEAPNSIIVDFTVSAQPKWIVADGTTYYEGAGYSYNSGTGKVTLDVAPSFFIRAIL